jgi:hypothetical protein
VVLARDLDPGLICVGDQLAERGQAPAGVAAGIGGDEPVRRGARSVVPAGAAVERGGRRAADEERRGRISAQRCRVVGVAALVAFVALAAFVAVVAVSAVVARVAVVAVPALVARLAEVAVVAESAVSAEPALVANCARDAFGTSPSRLSLICLLPSVFLLIFFPVIVWFLMFLPLMCTAA